jgi:hypothetical protein
MDMVRKLRPVGSAPRKVLIGAPVASPRTMIVFSPETKSSLIVQLRSGTTLASPLKRVIAAVCNRFQRRSRENLLLCRNAGSPRFIC